MALFNHEKLINQGIHTMNEDSSNIKTSKLIQSAIILVIVNAALLYSFTNYIIETIKY